MSEKSGNADFVTSSFCCLGDCIGLGDVRVDDQTGEATLRVVDTARPDEVSMIARRRRMAATIIGIQEGLLPREQAIDDLSINYAGMFPAQDHAAFYPGIIRGDFDAIAGVQEFMDSMPDDADLENFIVVDDPSTL